MRNRNFHQFSIEWIDRLTAAGCPIDGARLRQNAGEEIPRLRVTQLTGYYDSMVMRMPPSHGTIYALRLRIEAMRTRGIVVAAWSFTPPWRNHHITWGIDLRKWLSDADQVVGSDLDDTELWMVLEERRRVTLTRPVVGVLCGHSAQSIPDFVEGKPTAKGVLSLTDDADNTVTTTLSLPIERSRGLRVQKTELARRGGIFDVPDSVGESVGQYIKK